MAKQTTTKVDEVIGDVKEFFGTGEEKKVSKQEPPKISSRIFIKKIKEELRGIDIHAGVFTAFPKVVPPVDTEENYRKVWDTTFRRK